MSTAIPGTSKAGLLQRMDEAWTAFGGPTLALGARGLRERTSVGWTYAEMIGHVRAWHVLTARRLRAYAQTGAIDLPDAETSRAVFAELGLAPARAEALVRAWSTDAFNAAVAEVAAGASTHGLVPSLFASYRQLRDAVAALSDAQIQAHAEEGRSFVEALVEGNSYGHYAEHRSELEPALPRTAAELVARVDSDWTAVRDAVRRKGRAGLAEPAIEDWAYKDLLAHLIGWLQDVPRRIAAIRTGSDRPIAGQAEIDAYNARSVAERKLVGPEAIIDELNTSYRLVRDSLIGLSDAEVRDPRIRGLVATRTYLHWDEHAEELGR